MWLKAFISELNQCNSAQLINAIGTMPIWRDYIRGINKLLIGTLLKRKKSSMQDATPARLAERV
jgi:hypothetical protein